MLSKEDLKKDADKVALELGYNPKSVHIDVINVKDAYCNGYLNGRKEAEQIAIEFGRWITVNCSGRPNSLPENEWYYFDVDMERKRMTTEQLFELFKTENNIL